VVSPGTLLRTVWSSASSDEHVVGVTVGRLRRKLGAVSTAVRTVPRRGYRLDATALT
jgi:uroporphyrinogen-III synthase